MVPFLSWCFIPDKIKFWLALVLLHLHILSDLNLHSSLYISASPGVLMTGFMDLTRKMLYINAAVPVLQCCATLCCELMNVPESSCL